MAHGLSDYHKKRDFRSTPEPKGAPPKKGSGSLSFVIQKHEARKLHYDFRLEWDGVLKSWAVPKGVSADPADKRLAVATEDHPIEYQSFERNIPNGYGAGDVEIFDTGIWVPIEPAEEGFKKGKLKFELRGKRFKGVWTLVKSSRGKDQWLLIADKKGPEAFRKPAKKSKSGSEPSPQVATLATKVPTGSKWLYEIKYDGYRVLAYCNGEEVRLLTRNQNDWTDRFPEIAKSLQALNLENTVLDGEIVVFNKKGKPDFSALQAVLAGEKKAPLRAFFFDLLFLGGEDLRGQPLEARKEELEPLFEEAPENIQYAPHHEGQGAGLFVSACREDLEGLIAKDRTAKYHSGRSRHWLKIKCIKRQEFIVVGMTEPQGGRNFFGSLLMGYYNGDGELTYAGRVGTGFNSQNLAALHKRLKPHITKSTPLVHGTPPGNPIWVKPAVVIEVQFAEWTNDGHLRHPSYQGLREDKKPSEVTREEDRDQVEESSKKKTSPPSPDGKSQRSSQSDESVIQGVKITNPDKIYFPEMQISKIEVIRYYEGIAEKMLPHIINRPLSIVRCPNGWNKECFFQRHHAEGFSENVHEIAQDNKESYFYIKDVSGLIEMVQLGGIEVHTWGCRVKDIDKPDQVTFDLDPSEGVEWSDTVTAALQLREMLEELKLTSYVKTTGGKGLHVVVPLAPKRPWEDIKDFAHAIARLMSQGNPDRYIDKMSKQKRKGKIFVDWFRNARSHTSVAPWSVRARDGAPVSVPLTWEELDSGVARDELQLGQVEALIQRDESWIDHFDVKQQIASAHLKSLRKLLKDA